MSGGPTKTPEAAAKKQRNTVCHGHTRPICSVSYSHITTDGYFLASASKDGQPMLRMGETGDWLGTFIGHKGAVWDCVLNTPALLCATASGDFSARIWDACTGTQLHELPHKHIVKAAAFSVNTNKLATGGMEKTVRVYDVDNPTDPEQYSVQDTSIRNLVYLNDDNTLLCSYTDKSGIGVFDTRSRQLVKVLPTDAPVQSMELSFDGRHLTTAEGSSVRFWDAASLTQVKQHKVSGANAASASYCASKGLFVAGGADMWVRLFKYDTGEELECNKGHHGPVHAVRFAPTHDAYASGSEDGTIRLWYLDGTSSNGGAVANGNGVHAA